MSIKGVDLSPAGSNCTSKAADALAWLWIYSPAHQGFLPGQGQASSSWLPYNLPCCGGGGRWRAGVGWGEDGMDVFNGTVNFPQLLSPLQGTSLAQGKMARQGFFITRKSLCIARQVYYHEGKAASVGVLRCSSSLSLTSQPSLSPLDPPHNLHVKE